MEEEDIDKKVENFHAILRKKLDEFLPEKTVQISYLDKKWMNPQLKNLNRKVKREFHLNRKSPKWKKLKNKFKKLKSKTVKSFYSEFVNDLKTGNPAKWYSMAKRLGAEQQHSDGKLTVECLKGLDDKQSAEKIAQHFSTISQQYSPLSLDNLPAYLPAPSTLQVSKTEVAERLLKLKNRKSTQPIDIPSKLRKLFSQQLATPLTDIYNACLAKYQYPCLNGLCPLKRNQTQYC